MLRDGAYTAQYPALPLKRFLKDGATLAGDDGAVFTI
jgi:hypothetical protein